MQKTLLAIVALCLMNTAKAQKNSILVYGNLNMASTHSTDSTGQNIRTSYIMFDPAIGYQFSDHLTAGLLLGIGVNSRNVSTTDAVTGTVKTTQHTMEYSAGAFFRYTQPISNLFFFYGQFEGRYNAGTTKYNDSLIKGLNQSGFEANIVPALGLNVKNGLAVTLNIGGLTYNYGSNVAKSTQSNIILNFGQAINLGISKNFALKAHKIKASE